MRKSPLYALLLCLLADPALAEVPRVITDFGPVQSLVMDVMGDLGSATALLPKGGDPHDFQLRPSQAQLLAHADLVFWIGPELMPALGDALTSLTPQAQVTALLHASGQTRAFADGGIDPHAWLDPVNGAAWLGTIAETLAARDPTNAVTYRANATQAQTRLMQADTDWQTRLAPLRDRPVVTTHDALGYFTDHFGLTSAGAIALSDATPPSAARLNAVQSIMTQGRAVCIFPEAGRDPKFITALTKGLAVRIGPAQDIEFISLPAGRGQYLELLEQLVSGIETCLAN
jgi:zinc transport system substrate-binding protein